MANGLFRTPEQALAAEAQARQALALQAGATPLGAQGQEFGRTLAGAIGGAFGATPTESPEVQLARTRMETVQGLDFTDRNSLIQASRKLVEAGDLQGANQLASQALAIKPPKPEEKWTTYTKGNNLLRKRTDTGKVELVAKLDTNVGAGGVGKGGKPNIDLVTPANLKVLANATVQAIPSFYDLSDDKDGTEAYEAEYGQAVKDLAAAAKTAGVPLTIGEINEALAGLLSVQREETGFMGRPFGKYEIDDAGRNSFDTSLFRQDVAALRDQLFGTTSTGGLPEGLTETDIAANVAKGYTREEVIELYKQQRQ